MMRSPFLPLLFALLLAPLSAAGAPYRTVTVADEVVRVDDLFPRSGAENASVVARAPAPGGRIIIGSGRLRRIAASHGFDPQADELVRVMVKRDSRLIGLGEIETAVREAVAGAVPGKRLAVDLPSDNLRVYAASGGAVRIRVADLDIDLASERVTATLMIEAGEARPVQRRVTGRLVRIVDAPVAARGIAAGERIARRDIELVEMREDRLGPSNAISLAGVLGMETRRRVAPGAPFRRTDLQPPTLVTKDSLVTAELATASMRLTARVRALEDGAKGDHVRLINPRSKKIIEGRVEGPGRVVVAHPTAP